MSGLNIVTTILNLRTKGLSMMRMPLTVWSILHRGDPGPAGLPRPDRRPSLMLLFDRHFGTSFFLPAGLVLNNVPMLEPTAALTRAGRRCSGSTCSGSSAIPRSTS